MAVRDNLVLIAILLKLEFLGVEIDVRKIRINHVDCNVDPPHSGFPRGLTLTQGLQGFVVLTLAT